MKDYVAEFQNKLADIEKDMHSIYIINAGAMNHGKSSLFNSLLDSTTFAAQDVRTTIVNETVKWAEDVYLIDTPGLEAEEADDKMAYMAYRRANVIVFASVIFDNETQFGSSLFITSKPFAGKSLTYFLNAKATCSMSLK